MSLPRSVAAAARAHTGTAQGSTWGPAAPSVSASPQRAGRSHRAGRQPPPWLPAPCPPGMARVAFRGPCGGRAHTCFPACLSEHVNGKSLINTEGSCQHSKPRRRPGGQGDRSERSWALPRVSFLAWGQCASAQEPRDRTSHLPQAGSTQLSLTHPLCLCTACPALENASPQPEASLLPSFVHT